MTRTALRLLQLALLLLVAGQVLGVVAAANFLAPEAPQAVPPFNVLRPLHVSAGIFWILTGAIGGLMFHVNELSAERPHDARLTNLAAWGWLATLLGIFASLLGAHFGGRKYWEFPPALVLPVGLCWALFAAVFFGRQFFRRVRLPVYVWMWATGLVFFLLSLAEANLWLIPWFRENVVRDITVQWKANGAIVGAWNQILYGTALYLMTRISGDEDSAHRWQSFLFYFLGLSNLMFNWGHHVYNLPTAPWIRHVAYLVSMSEWILFIHILRAFRVKLGEARRLAHLIPYRFLLAAEIWVFLNLMLALLISIPAVNAYTHGTHVTVAHAMGAAIGINTMILLASLFHIFSQRDPGLVARHGAQIKLLLAGANGGLFVFWVALIAAGVTKGDRMVVHGQSFEVAMASAHAALYVFAAAGVVVAASLIGLALLLLRARVLTPGGRTLATP